MQTKQPGADAAVTGLQQLLTQFDSDVAKSEAAKETMLVQLVMLVTDSMYVPAFALSAYAKAVWADCMLPLPRSCMFCPLSASYCLM